MRLKRDDGCCKSSTLSKELTSHRACHRYRANERMSLTSKGVVPRVALVPIKMVLFLFFEEELCTTITS